MQESLSKERWKKFLTSLHQMQIAMYSRPSRITRKKHSVKLKELAWTQVSFMQISQIQIMRVPNNYYSCRFLCYATVVLHIYMYCIYIYIYIYIYILFLPGGNLHEMTEVFDGIETKTSLLGIALDVEASSSSLLERSEYLSTPGRKKAIEAAEAAKQQTFKAASCLYKSIDKAKNMFWGENGEKVIPASYSGMNFEGLSVQLVTKKCRDQIARNEFLELMQMANESEIGITEKCDILEILYSFGMIYLQIYPEKTIAFLQYCTYLAKMSYYINVKGLLEFDTIVRKSFIQNSDRNWQISDIKSLTNPVYYERYHYDGRYPEFCRNWNYGDCVSEWCYREHACRICGKNDDHKALDCIFRA